MMELEKEEIADSVLCFINENVLEDSPRYSCTKCNVISYAIGFRIRKDEEYEEFCLNCLKNILRDNCGKPVEMLK